VTSALVVVLLIAAALANIGPEAMAAAFGDSIRAWEYVSEGALAAVLWLALLVLLIPHRRVRVAAAAICSYGATEAALRPACRLAFPMDRPPTVPAPEGLCAAAGWPWWWELSPLALSLCAVAVAHLSKGRP